MKKLTILLAILILAGCAKHNHYRGYLALEKADGYHVSESNFIKVPKDSWLNIKISEMKLGFLHRKSENATDSEESTKIHEGLGGKEIWLVSSGYSIDSNDPLGKNETRFVKASNVKINQESFSLIPLDAVESIIFDQIMKTSFRLKLRIYEVDGFELKKLLYQSTSKSLGKWLLDTLTIWGENIGNVFAKEAIDMLKQRTGEEMFIEQLLLSADASLEFETIIDLLAVDADAADDILNSTYVAIDVVKSLYDPEFEKKTNDTSVLLKPKDIEQYKSMYKKIHETVIPTPSAEEHSYIKFNVVEPGPDERNRLAITPPT